MARKKNRNELSSLPKCDADLSRALYESFLMARRGKLNTNNEFKFEMFWFENLEQLKEDIIARRYKPSRSKAFIISNPVYREIFAAPFRDRVVHHLLYAIVAPWWDKRFIPDATSCRNDKGTDYAVARLQRFMRKASLNGQREAYVIKGDISGYFMSLRRKLLYEKIIWGLERQFSDRGWLYDLCAYLWKEIIFDDPIEDVRIAGKITDWKVLPLNKSLFNQPEGQGIVIGNLTSQLLSNVFMNNFDWYMKKRLGFEYYGRYVDDFFIVVTKENLSRAQKAMKGEVPEFLSNMGLTLHPKKQYLQKVEKGCPFLGKMVYLNALLPGRRYKVNMKKAMIDFASGYGDIETVISYIGMAKNMSAKKLLDNTFERVGWKYRY